MRNYELTGSFYHKSTLFGLVLYVEIEWYEKFASPNGRMIRRYRKFKKASLSDASTLKVLTT